MLSDVVDLAEGLRRPGDMECGGCDAALDSGDSFACDPKRPRRAGAALHTTPPGPARSFDEDPLARDACEA